MAEQSEYRLSQESIRLAQAQAQESRQHGESVENVGEKVPADGKSIADQGRAIQEQLEMRQAHLQQLQQTESLEANGKIVEDHVQASLVPVKAVREYLESPQPQANEMSQHTPSHRARNLYEQLMALSQQALRDELYETAYHALTAAFHTAEALEEEQLVLAVEREAKAQQDWIDTHRPKHRLSTQSTTPRKGISLYHSLTRQAATRVLLIKQKHRQEEAKPLPWPSDAKGEGHF